MVLFLVTCLTGHPLLIADVQFVVAFVLGAAGAYERTAAVRWVKPIRLDDDGRHMLPPLEG